MKYLPALFLLLLATLAWGTEYTPLTVPTKADITKIVFPDRLNGWAVTATGQVLSTFDGGKTWKAKQVTNRPITDIQFRGKQGYLTGERGLVMKTTDGGASWQDISLNIKFNFSGVGILDDTSTIIIGTDQNSMAKTVGVSFQTWDRGKTWKKKPFLGNGLFDVVTWPPHKVYVLAIKKSFHSIDGGGYYWSGKYEGNRLGFAFDFQDDWGYMVGNGGLFMKSTDHGRNWKEVPLQITKNLNAVAMIDHFSGIAAGQDGIVVDFTQSGDQYTVENIGLPVSIASVAITADKVFLAGQNGTIVSRPR
jgi:photosystem II stability/assembly factor-like uncharacterized protein